MGTRYQHLAFGPGALDRQRVAGSLPAYGAGLATPDEGPQELDRREIHLLESVFQFHMATVTPAGWPYVQYRSGPRGFLQHLGGNRIGFVDLPGNRQFVSAGNLDGDDRVALFVADLPLRSRLKVFGRARVVGPDEDPDLLERLRHVGGREMGARAERSVVIDVEAFDWNCSRSLVPQYTADEVRERTRPYVEEIRRLRARIAELESGAG